MTQLSLGKTLDSNNMLLELLVGLLAPAGLTKLATLASSWTP